MKRSLNVMYHSGSASGARVMKVFGLPVQFLAVVLVSSALFVYLLAAAAESRVEARTHRQRPGSAQTLTIEGKPPRRLADFDSGSIRASKELWESAFLFVCPLH